MIDTILSRRSIRRFQERSVERDVLQMVLRAAMQAPSAKNERPWEFLIVQERKMLQTLSCTDPYAGSVKNAPLAIILLCNREKYLKEDDTFWQQDMAAAAENLLLAAHGYGLGAVWLAIAPLQERIDFVARALGLPIGVVPFAMIPVGYPLREKAVEERYDAGRVYHERYPMG